MNKKNFSQNCFEELAIRCNESGVEFHVYCQDWDEKRYSRLVELDRELRFFHFHKPVPYEVLLSTIRQYDYGVLPTKVGVEKQRDGELSPLKFEFAGTNKVFDYVEAGLPFIGATPKRLLSEFIEKGACIPWYIEDYDFDFLRDQVDIMKQKVRNIQQEYLMDNQIYRLLDFYDEILNEKER